MLSFTELEQLLEQALEMQA